MYTALSNTGYIATVDGSNGAFGGFTAEREEIVELLRQVSRPYLFSNTIVLSIVGESLKVL